MNALLQCPKCRAWLLEGTFNQPDWTPCPACGAPLEIEVFPALFRKIASGPSAETILVEGESSCFYHPQKKAVRPCDGCGRFLCALCDCEFQGRHFCPSCLEAGRTKGKIAQLENQRTRYDNIALALAVLPFFVFYFTLITAPMALFVAIRYWKSPASLTGQSRTRFVIAILVALLQLAGWTIFFVMMATHRHRS